MECSLSLILVNIVESRNLIQSSGMLSITDLLSRMPNMTSSVNVQIVYTRNNEVYKWRLRSVTMINMLFLNWTCLVLGRNVRQSQIVLRAAWHEILPVIFLIAV